MSIRYKYLLGGILFGLLFPIVSIIIDCCVFHNNEFSFDKVGAYLNSNPIHYIVLTAPLFLGFAFFFIGYFVEKQNNLVEKLQRNYEILNDANESLDSFNYHVSHDLKTVLINTESLTLMLQKYIEKGNGEKTKMILSKLIDTSRIGKETIQSFLEFGKATSIIYKDNAEVLDLKDEISKIISTHFLDEKLEFRIQIFPIYELIKKLWKVFS